MLLGPGCSMLVGLGGSHTRWSQGHPCYLILGGPMLVGLGGSHARWYQGHSMPLGSGGSRVSWLQDSLILKNFNRKKFS